MKLVRIRNVEIFPYGGWAGRPWDENPAWDCFAKSARGVSERYSELLGSLGGQLGSRLLRIEGSSFPDQTGVDVEIGGDLYEFEMASARIPASVAAMSPYDLSLLALEVQHRACVALAGWRGANVEPFEQARQTLLDEGLDHVWRSIWKASPDRRHQARLAQRIESTGFAQLWIEVAPRGAELPLGRSGFVVSPGNLRAFGRVATRLRWHGSEEAWCEPEFTGAASPEAVARVESLAVDIPRGGRRREPDHPIPPIQVRVTSKQEGGQTARVVIGSRLHGIPSLAPPSFREAWRRIGVAEEALLPWWKTSQMATLRISAWVHDGPGRSSVRFDGRDVEVKVIRRPRALDFERGAEQVLEVLEDAIRLASRKVGISPTAVPGEVAKKILGSEGD